MDTRVSPCQKRCERSSEITYAGSGDPPPPPPPGRANCLLLTPPRPSRPPPAPEPWGLSRLPCFVWPCFEGEPGASAPECRGPRLRPELRAGAPAADADEKKPMTF